VNVSANTDSLGGKPACECPWHDHCGRIQVLDAPILS
jgi:hypothetical protein